VRDLHFFSIEDLERTLIAAVCHTVAGLSVTAGHLGAGPRCLFVRALQRLQTVRTAVSLAFTRHAEVVFGRLEDRLASARLLHTHQLLQDQRIDLGNKLCVRFFASELFRALVGGDTRRRFLQGCRAPVPRPYLLRVEPDVSDHPVPCARAGVLDALNSHTAAGFRDWATVGLTVVSWALNLGADVEGGKVLALVLVDLFAVDIEDLQSTLVATVRLALGRNSTLALERGAFGHGGEWALYRLKTAVAAVSVTWAASLSTGQLREAAQGVGDRAVVAVEEDRGAVVARVHLTPHSVFAVGGVALVLRARELFLVGEWAAANSASTARLIGGTAEWLTIQQPLGGAGTTAIGDANQGFVARFRAGRYRSVGALVLTLQGTQATWAPATGNGIVNSSRSSNRGWGIIVVDVDVDDDGGSSSFLLLSWASIGTRFSVGEESDSDRLLQGRAPFDLLAFAVKNTEPKNLVALAQVHVGVVLTPARVHAKLLVGEKVDTSREQAFDLFALPVQVGEPKHFGFGGVAFAEVELGHIAAVEIRGFGFAHGHAQVVGENSRTPPTSVHHALRSFSARVLGLPTIARVAGTGHFFEPVGTHLVLTHSLFAGVFENRGAVAHVDLTSCSSFALLRELGFVPANLSLLAVCRHFSCTPLSGLAVVRLSDKEPLVFDGQICYTASVLVDCNGRSCSSPCFATSYEIDLADNKPFWFTFEGSSPTLLQAALDWHINAHLVVRS